MRKNLKYFFAAILILAATCALSACSVFGGDKELKAKNEELTAANESLQAQIDEEKEKNKTLLGNYAALQESSRAFFEITAPGVCTVSPPLFFGGSAAGENPYADLSSPTAQYTAQSAAVLRAPTFTAGRDVYYRLTCVFMQTGMYTITFGFADLQALDMTASIKALFRLYVPGAGGPGGVWQGESLFMLSPVGSGRTGIMITTQVTSGTVNTGFTLYFGYNISNSGQAPVFAGKAFAVDSLAITVAKTA